MCWRFCDNASGRLGTRSRLACRRIKVRSVLVGFGRVSNRGGEQLEGLLSLRVVCIRSGPLFEEHEVALSGAVVRLFVFVFFFLLDLMRLFVFFFPKVCRQKCFACTLASGVGD